MLIATSLVFGVLSSLAASLVWLLALRSVRPKVQISPTIAEEITAQGQPRYRIKFVNMSRRAIVDLRLELSLVVPTPAKGGLVKRRRPLELTNTPLLVPGRDKSNDDDNAYRIRCDEDLRSQLDAERGGYLRFRLYARDEVSGIGRLFEARFHDPESEIIRGNFSKGQNIEIIPAGRTGATEESEVPARHSAAISAEPGPAQIAD